VSSLQNLNEARDPSNRKEDLVSETDPFAYQRENTSKTNGLLVTLQESFRQIEPGSPSSEDLVNYSLKIHLCARKGCNTALVIHTVLEDPSPRWITCARTTFGRRMFMRES
jgi:hypothetical protein